MALLKEIKQKNGIKMNYHRIISINNITNISTIIEVGSYIDEEERKLQIQIKELLNKDFTKLTDDEKEILTHRVIVESKDYLIEYDAEMTVEKAYEYLKTLDVFSNAQDC